MYKVLWIGHCLLTTCSKLPTFILGDSPTWGQAPGQTLWPYSLLLSICLPQLSTVSSFVSVSFSLHLHHESEILEQPILRNTDWVFEKKLDLSEAYFYNKLEVYYIWERKYLGPLLNPDITTTKSEFTIGEILGGPQTYQMRNKLMATTWLT